MRSGQPWAGQGQVVGLLGGSFDPAHAGHAHITREALRRFGLDQVWWLVSPGNPLKPDAPAALEARMARARGVMDHPAVRITDLEADLGTRYTAETLAALRTRMPALRFVWLMGADNLAQFHQWETWRAIFAQVPVGVLARPGQRMAALNSPAARCFAHARLRGDQMHGLGRSETPAWAFATIPMDHSSSSAIRAAGDWASRP
ncbi:nicotinate-nucleotide adenylyltransferase [Dinoroseobacter sp. S76]|uniref:nicotinate-nucleotide adenylyltransferase n=1 Tax=Dinoroseobacter sp. S76 TaxID=3415124 RepID=UPI003C7D52EF